MCAIVAIFFAGIVTVFWVRTEMICARIESKSFVAAATEAIDWMLANLAEITRREEAQGLCQIFFDGNIFKPYSTCNGFEDKALYYRFHVHALAFLSPSSLCISSYRSSLLPRRTRKMVY